jgi:adenosylcobinamide kinase/adenosylcobinamide-phosphate guanylyltransferase
MLPDVSLVLGGAASGKSAYAEALLDGAQGRRVYLATARVHDAEMRDKVDRHRRLRGGGWQTVEAPLEPGPALAAAPAGSAVLLDCATMWLSNHLLDETDLPAAEAALMDGLDACPGPVVVVSNEVGLSVVPENALARRFREAQGRLNQRLAARADLVVNIVAGLPQVLKGQLP